MSRTTLLLLLCALARATIVTDQPTLSDRLEKLYKKLATLSPKTTELLPSIRTGKLRDYEEKSPTTERIDKLYEKMERLNSLTPDKFYTEDDEELLDALQQWGMLDDEMAEARDLRQFRPYSEVYDDEDLDLIDDDYAMDDGDDLELEDKEGTTDKTVTVATPSALNRMNRIGTTFPAISAVSAGIRSALDVASTRDSPGVGEDIGQIIVSSVDSIAATKKRPRILDDPPQERAAIARAARAYLSMMVPLSKCRVPQPRWLSVRQLAPASDTLYRPTCVLLHRCAADSGCCHNEEHICAPVEGQYVDIPLYLRTPDGLTAARMQFFNHTRCACVSHDTLQEVRRPPRRNLHEHRSPEVRDQYNPMQDSHGPGKPAQDVTIAEESHENKIESEGNVNQSDWSTQEPKLDSDTAAPPQLKRCTCPTLFMARVTDASCACVCDWTDLQRRRDCLSLSRGREHFGLRDRVCVANGDCNPPTCEYGAYERNFGRCPLRSSRRLRFTSRRYLDRTLS